MKLKFILALIVFIIVALPTPVLAKKKIIRGKSSGVWIKPKLRSDHQALILAFGGLNYITDLNYTLTYSSLGTDQGVQGSHHPETTNFQTELLFGTCSGTNCSYHQNITNMLLEVKLKLKTGKTLIQHYQIKP